MQGIVIGGMILGCGFLAILVALDGIFREGKGCKNLFPKDDHVPSENAYRKEGEDGMKIGRGPNP